MRILFNLIMIIGGAILVYYLPSLLWNTNWENIIELLQFNENDAICKQIADSLNLQYETAQQWAIKKTLICAGITAGYLFITCLISKALKPTRAK